MKFLIDLVDPRTGGIPSTIGFWAWLSYSMLMWIHFGFLAGLLGALGVMIGRNYAAIEDRPISYKPPDSMLQGQKPEIPEEKPKV